MRYSITTTYIIKWEIEGYYITECSKIINPKTNKIIKESVVNSSIGFYLNRKFRTKHYIKNNCNLITCNTDNPFEDLFKSINENSRTKRSIKQTSLIA